MGFLTPSITSQQEPQYRNCPLPQTSSSSWWPIHKLDIIKPVVQPPTPPWWLFPVVFSLAPSPRQCCRPCPHRRPVGKSFKRKALLLLQSVKRKNLDSLVKPPSDSAPGWIDGEPGDSLTAPKSHPWEIPLVVASPFCLLLAPPLNVFPVKYIQEEVVSQIIK